MSSCDSHERDDCSMGSRTACVDYWCGWFNSSRLPAVSLQSDVKGVSYWRVGSVWPWTLPHLLQRRATAKLLIRLQAWSALVARNIGCLHEPNGKAALSPTPPLLHYMCPVPRHPKFRGGGAEKIGVRSHDPCRMQLRRTRTELLPSKDVHA